MNKSDYMEKIEREFDKISETISMMSDEDVVECYNIYLISNNYDDEQIYYMDDIESNWCHCSIHEILENIDFEEFDVNDTFYHYTIYGCSSFSDVFADNSPIANDMGELVLDIYHNHEKYTDILEIAELYDFE